MNGSKSVTATFVSKPVLTVTLAGADRHRDEFPEWIDCPADCSEDYDTGTPVTLTAIAAPAVDIHGWSRGDCSGLALLADDGASTGR